MSESFYDMLKRMFSEPVDHKAIAKEAREITEKARKEADSIIERLDRQVEKNRAYRKGRE